MGETDRAAYFRLAVEIIRQALRDARRGDQAALAWLRDEGGDWVELVGGDPGALRRVVSDLGGADDGPGA